MNDYKLFITSVLLLVGLTVLGTALQNRPAPAPAAAPAAAQTKSAATAAPQTATAPAGAPQPGTAPVPAAKPQIRGYNGGEYGDD